MTSAADHAVQFRTEAFMKWYRRLGIHPYFGAVAKDANLGVVG